MSKSSFWLLTSAFRLLSPGFYLLASGFHLLHHARDWLALRLKNCSTGGMPIQTSPKLTGVLVPLFALRSSHDLGIGDTGCVREMVDWCARHNLRVLQLLPSNETGDDNSPYNAISSMALDPATLTVDPLHLKDLTREDFSRIVPPRMLAELRKGPVSYRKVKPLKLKLLREAFSHFLKKHDARSTERARHFRSFVQEEAAWIGDYGLFRALMQRHGGLPVWEQWPPEHRTPAAARSWLLSLAPHERAAFEEDCLFHAYVQWIALDQWLAVRRHAEAKGVQLMGDIPFGVGRCSVDVWSQRHLFDLRWSCGAPPESFFKPDLFTERWGQNWGIPLYRWDRMREEDYAWWRARVRATSRVFSLFRIDHVLGFYRIYAFPWKPEDNGLYVNLSHDEARAKAGDLPRFWPNHDETPESRDTNHRQGEELLRMVLDAAGDTGVVAEDLGMVPSYVRPSLTLLGIPGFKIPLFERTPDGNYRDPSEYGELSVATLATHDHEPMASLWQGWWDAAHGPQEREHLLRWIGWDPSHPPRDFTPELHAAIGRKLLTVPSWLAVFMITDLFGGTQRFNVPGPMNGDNWTERLPLAIADFDKDPDLKARLGALEEFFERRSA